MNYVIAIKSPVYGQQAASLAYQVTQTLIETKHHISQIFFFQEGVNNGGQFISPASDEINLQQKWQDLAKAHNIPLHLCISGAARRGITPQNLAAPFILAGLGEFSRAVIEADRLLTF